MSLSPGSSEERPPIKIRLKKGSNEEQWHCATSGDVEQRSAMIEPVPGTSSSSRTTDEENEQSTIDQYCRIPDDKLEQTTTWLFRDEPNGEYWGRRIAQNILKYRKRLRNRQRVKDRTKSPVQDSESSLDATDRSYSRASTVAFITLSETSGEKETEPETGSRGPNVSSPALGISSAAIDKIPDAGDSEEIGTLPRCAGTVPSDDLMNAPVAETHGNLLQFVTDEDTKFVHESVENFAQLSQKRTIPNSTAISQEPTYRCAASDCPSSPKKSKHDDNTICSTGSTAAYDSSQTQILPGSGVHLYGNGGVPFLDATQISPCLPRDNMTANEPQSGATVPFYPPFHIEVDEVRSLKRDWTDKEAEPIYEDISDWSDSESYEISGERAQPKKKKSRPPTDLLPTETLAARTDSIIPSIPSNQPSSSSIKTKSDPTFLKEVCSKIRSGRQDERSKGAIILDLNQLPSHEIGPPTKKQSKRGRGRGRGGRRQ